MDPFTAELIKQGILGIFGAIFLYLFLKERSDHQKTRDKLEQSWADRVNDSKENMEKVTVPLQGISQGIQNLSDKIEIGRKR